MEIEKDREHRWGWIDGRAEIVVRAAAVHLIVAIGARIEFAIYLRGDPDTVGYSAHHVTNVPSAAWNEKSKQ